VLELPLYMQALAYPAKLDRQLIADIFDVEGVLTPAGGALKVGPRAAGANMSVDIAPGTAIIAGDSEAGQGSYRVRSSAVENLPVGAAPGSNSRIDLVIARVRDATVVGGVSSDWLLEVLPGAVAMSPVAPALPASAIPLAEIVVVAAAGVVSIDAAKITDRRAAAGNAAYVAKATRPPGYAEFRSTIGPSDFVAESALSGLSVTVNVAAGRRLLVTVSTFWTSVNEGAGIALRIKEGAATLQERQRRLTPVLSQELSASVVLTPTAGAHTYHAAAIRTDGDTGNKTVPATANHPAYILIQDIGAA